MISNRTNKSSDLLFSGEITKYEFQPVSIQDTEIAAQNRLTISLKINYINNLDSSLNNLARSPSK